MVCFQMIYSLSRLGYYVFKNVMALGPPVDTEQVCLSINSLQKILSSLTHPQVASNMYAFLSSAEHEGRYFEECW